MHTHIAPSAKTAATWRLAHSALCRKDWIDARGWLEQLASLPDNVDLLCEAGSYGEPPHLVDRVAAANDSCRRNQTRRAWEAAKAAYHGE